MVETIVFCTIITALIMLPLLVICLLFVPLTACQSESVEPIQFNIEPTMTKIDAGQVEEASGIADSRSMPGALWVAEDSGNPAELTLLGYDGHVRGKLKIPNATNRDWEDLSIGPGPQANVNYLYIAEIGDNTAQYGQYTVYRLPEPQNLTAAVGPAERINFKYPDGARDAEALLVDPQTRDLYIVSKREAKVHLYRLAYPQSTSDVMTAELLGDLPFTYITGGAFSPNGSEIVLRSYTNIFHWNRKSGQSVANAMRTTTSTDLPYRFEPQGEAICFNHENKGYFTLSEKANNMIPTLNYYLRKK